MTVRKTITQPTREVKRFTVSEIDAGIRKLRRRVEEVIGLALGFHYSDSKAKTAEHNIRETIPEVFGQNSPELDDHQYHCIGDDGYTMGATDYEMQLNFLAGIPQTAGMLEGPDCPS